jgi:hypothetical protein
MTVWRDAQGQAEKPGRQNEWKPVRVLGWGEKCPVLVAVDLGEGQPVAVGYVDEQDPQAVQRWLEPLVQRLGVSIIVTDDLVIYKGVAQRLNLEHQICQFHVRRWVRRALKELQNTLPKEWLWVLEEIKELMEDLPPEGDRRLYALWKQVAVRRGKGIDHLTPVEQLKDLLIRLSEIWSNFCTFYPVDQSWHRAGDWQDENACSHGAGLPNLARHADWLDAGRNKIQLILEDLTNILLSHQFPKFANRACY